MFSWSQVFSRTPLSFQVQHLCNLVVFLLLGKLNAHMGVTWTEIAATAAAAVATEWVGRRVVGSPSAHFPVPSLIAAFAVCMILRSPSSWVLPLAASVGIASKYLLRSGGAHFQNPSNFAVLFAVLALPDRAFLQSSEWDLNPVGYLVVLGAGVLLVVRAGLVVETGVGLGSLIAARYAVETRNLDALAFGLFHVTLLLYVFFLQNDPRVLPPTRKGRIAFLVLAAALHVGLNVVFGKRDSNLPLSLALASLSIPFWRWSAKAMQRPAWTGRAELALYALPPVLLLGLYTSPLNRRANLLASIQEAKRAGPAVPDAPGAAPDVRPASAPAPGIPLPAAKEGPWADTWETGALVRLPLPPAAPRGPSTFVRKDILPPSHPGSPERFTAWMFAGVAAGDVDHDGHLDVLVSGEGRPLGAWLWREGRFQDFTAQLFPEGPLEVDQVVLADMDGDGWLDAVMTRPQYAPGAPPGGIWRFVPEKGHFTRQASPALGAGRKSSGGIALHDVNGDGILDAYVSFGLDWLYREPDFLETPSPHEFWVSTGPGTWREEWKQRLPAVLTRTSYAGMTPYFGDVDGDGALELLVGNDFLDPSLYLRQQRDGLFALVDPGYVEANTTYSMSYVPADFDGDGQEELLEVGLAPPYWNSARSDVTVDARTPTPRQRDVELKDLILTSSRGTYECGRYQDGLVKWLCDTHLRTDAAVLKSDLSACAAQPPGLAFAVCERTVRRVQLYGFGTPQSVRYDVEMFPKQVTENVLLRLKSQEKGFRMVRQDVPVEFTGWSWAAYPEDLDGDGRLDVAVTNSYMKAALHPNRVLRNVSSEGKPRLKDVTAEVGLAFEDQSRGLVAADFDEDGDADLLIGNVAGEFSYWENQAGGDRLEVELRMRGGNRYGLGTELELVTSSGRQKRRLAVGGVWNTGQPHRVRFSLPAGTVPKSLEVKWPNGARRSVKGLRPNERLVVFE